MDSSVDTAPALSTPPPPASGHHTVLFDLDGVLLRDDTMASLVKHVLVRRPWRLPAAAVLLATSLALPSHGPGRPRVNRALVRLALRGTKEPHYNHLTRRIVEQLVRNPDTRNDELIQEAVQLRSAGRQVIVVTASERRMARGYLDAVGLRQVELLASELTFTPTRPPNLTRHNVGHQKIAALRDHQVDLAGCLLYTDSASDLPLMRCVAASILVEPSPSTLRAIRHANQPATVTVRSSRDVPEKPVSGFDW